MADDEAMADTIIDGLIRNAARAPDTDCIVFDDEVISFGSFTQRVDRSAAVLLGAGLHAGDRVALLAPTSPLFFELLFACARAGLVLVPVNSRLAGREVGEVLADAEPGIVIVSEELSHLVPADAPWRLFLQPDFIAWTASAPHAPLPVGAVADDPVLILYTSGTTGTPKGVVLSQRNLSYLARMGRLLWEFDRTSTNMVATPLFHIGGIGWGLLALTQGGRTVLARDSAPETLVAIMQRHAITHSFMVPTVVQKLLDHFEQTGVPAPPIGHLFYGAAPIGDTLLRRALAAFGCSFHHVYGMTETAGTVVTLDPEDHDPDGPHPQRLQSCGKAMPWVEIAIVDPATGQQLGPDQVGEVRLRSHAITKGYWRKARQTAEAITADGWLCTGDAGELDADGYLYLRDRYKDMIVSGGENIYPKEIENVLQAHPAVAEVAVVGMPHEKWGETPWAWVVLRADGDATSEDLIAFTRESLARYKAPSAIVFVDQLPRNASGKVMKHHLREQT